MKKLMSTCTALLLALCMLLPAYSAFAAEDSNEAIISRLEKASAQAEGASDFLYKDKTFGVADAVDMLAACRGFNASEAQMEAFTAAVEKELKANGGKLYYPVPVYDENYTQTGTDNVEELELYAAVICVYDAIGEDYTNVAGYDLSKLMQNCGTTAVYGSNYYLYRLVTEACDIVEAPESFVQSVIKNLTAMYKMGEGPDFWGYGASADDLGAFLTALAPYADDYQTYIDDAVELLEKNVTDDGYTSWGSANADSTAMALMAYSALGDKDKADKAYDLLCKFESDTTGVFTYGGEVNDYATKDALTALNYYADHLISRYVYEPDTEPTTKQDETTTAKTKKDTTVTTTKATTKKSTSTKSPATGNTAGLPAALAITAAGACLLLAKKRK